MEKFEVGDRVEMEYDLYTLSLRVGDRGVVERIGGGKVLVKFEGLSSPHSLNEEYLRRIA